jgi:large subunit ribosomal protein L1
MGLSFPRSTFPFLYGYNTLINICRLRLMADKKIVETVEKMKTSSKENERKFTQTVDVVINLKNIDLNIPKNRIDEEVKLPKGRGTEAKIALFASGELALKSKDIVDFLIKPEEIEGYSDDKKAFKRIADDHDYFIAEAPLMPTIGKTLGTVLGPRGKMPRPVPPAADLTDMVKNLRNTVKIRSKTNTTFHTVVGNEKMSSEDIADNIQAIIKRLEGTLERGKMNIRSVYVKTTMGPSEKVM